MYDTHAAFSGEKGQNRRRHKPQPHAQVATPPTLLGQAVMHEVVLVTGTRIARSIPVL